MANHVPPSKARSNFKEIYEWEYYDRDCRGVSRDPPPKNPRYKTVHWNFVIVIPECGQSFKK